MLGLLEKLSSRSSQFGGGILTAGWTRPLSGMWARTCFGHWDRDLDLGSGTRVLGRDDCGL
jgi:hypothetical protein